MEKKKDAQIVVELSKMLEKQTLNVKGTQDGAKPLRENEMRSELDKLKGVTANQSLMKIIMTSLWKVEDIIAAWKPLIPDPLNCDSQALQECISTEDNQKVLQALFSTFRQVKDMQDYLNEQRSLVRAAEKLDPTISNPVKEGHTFINRELFSSDSESGNEKEDDDKVQCDLSGKEGEKGGKTPKDPETTESISLRSDVDSQTDLLNNGADETVYEDCEEDDTYDAESSESSESEEDPSWVVSEDSSGSEDEEKKRMTMKDLPKVNFAKTNTALLGIWLSDTGPVHLNTMCHCKGFCVRNCACRTAGISCSRRCGCKQDKCKFRKVQEVEVEEDFLEEYTERLRTKKTLTEPNNDKMTKMPPSTPTQICPPSSVDPVFCTPAPLPRPAKTNPEDTPANEVFSTPACRPPTHTTDSSFLSTTAKKRNKKKLFTDSIGPQEL